MIKLGLKNYFKSYRLFFMPIGALALGIVAGLSIFLPALFGAIKAFFSGAIDILGGIKPNWSAVWDTIVATFSGVDYSDLEIAAGQVFSRDFFSALFNDCLHAAIDTDALIAEFQELFASCAMKAVGGGIALLALTVLGAVVGVFVTRVEIRRNVAKRKLWKFLLVSLVHTLINVTIIAGGVWLISKVKNIAALSALLTILLYGAVSFFEAYLVHGYKKVPLRRVMRIRNILALTLLSVIELVIAAAFIALAYVITNVVLSALIGYAVLVITFSCMSLNAEAYVKDVASAYAKKDAEAAPAAHAETAPAEVAATKESNVGNPPAKVAEESAALGTLKGKSK